VVSSDVSISNEVGENDNEPDVPQFEEFICDHDVSSPDLVTDSDEYFLESDISSAESEKNLFRDEKREDDFELLLESKLKTWAIQNNIAQSSLNSLLKILHPLHPILPLDSRTLLDVSNKVVDVTDMPPGKYWHFGIHNALKILIPKMSEVNSKNLTKLHLDFNIDGLPISKSSGAQIWPILCKLRELDFKPFVIGAYYGHSKPKNMDKFFKMFMISINY
jgi:hypothetical protein